MFILKITNSIIFLLISILHIYWAFDGKWGYDYVIPSQLSGAKTFKPSKIITLIVSLGLIIFSFTMLVSLKEYSISSNFYYIKYIIYFITIIFFIRTVGDFKYIGLTKNIKDTKFAVKDTTIFTPLTLFISLSCMVIIIYSK